MSDQNPPRTPLARYGELLAYIAFAGLLAILVTWALRPSPAIASAAPAPTVTRSKDDAAKLRSYLGLASSKPAIVEFMDFECPPCRASWPKVKQILKQFPNAEYRPINFPLQMHPFAFGAAVATEVARSKGQFEPVFDDLFSGATNLDVKSLNLYLSKRKLDPCVGTPRSKAFQAKVREAQKVGKDLQINATPTLMVLLPDGSLTEVHSMDKIAQLLSSAA